MKFLSSSLLSSLLCLFALEGEAAERKSKENEPPLCNSSSPMRIRARHIEANGIGYNQGYTTVEGFFPLYNGWENWVLFLDTRMHVFNSGRPALNAGLGTRYLADSRAWGLNAYYDYRKTKHQHYNQFAMGFESLGEIWDFRCNGYVPVGKTKSESYQTQFYEFQGNSAILSQKYEFAMAGFNVEAGAHVRCWEKCPLYFAAGPYYLTGTGATTWGGQARASLLIYDYLKLEAYTSYDHLFKWTGQGQVGLNFSFGSDKKVQKKGGNTSSYCYTHTVAAYQPVDRFEIVPVDKKHNYSQAINPRTGDPYYFVFVDNTSSSAGTYESPYPTLAEAETNSSSDSVIYLFPGDGTTTGMAAGIVLKDYQRLWGSGVTQTLPTTVGSVLIPPQSNSTLNGVVFNPMIANTGTVVTLANGNEISGLFLQNGAMANAVSGSNITDATILNCTMAGANVQGGIGVHATELAGTLTMSNCFLTQNIGVELSNSTTNLETNISNSNFAGGDGSTTSSFFWTLSDAAQGTLTATNNTFSSAYTAIQVAPGGTSSIAATFNNNVIATGGYGIYINGSGSAAQDLNIGGNTITAYYQSIWIAESGALEANIAYNTLNSTETYCVEIDTTGGNGSVLMSNNLVNSADTYSVYLNQTGGSVSYTLNENKIFSVDDEYALYSEVGVSAVNHTLNLNGNTLAGDYGWYLEHQGGTVSSTWNNNYVSAYDYGIYIDASASALSETLAFNGNNIIGEYGFYVDQAAGALSLTLNNNTIATTSDDYGVYWDAHDTATNTDIVMNGNQVFAYYPIYSSQTVGNLNLSITDNVLSGGYGAYLSFSTTGTSTMNMSGNDCSGYYGVYVQQTAGTFNPTITNNTIASAGSVGYTYFTGSLVAANSTQAISGNTIESGPFGSNAISFNVETTGTVGLTVTDNLLSGGGGSSAGSTVSCSMSGGTQSLDLSNNTLTNSGGYSLAAAGSVAASWKVNGNQFLASGSPPVTAAASGSGTTVCMQLNNNTAYPTAGAYALTNTSPATFTLNSPTGDIGDLGNVGELVITNVTQGTCP